MLKEDNLSKLTMLKSWSCWYQKFIQVVVGVGTGSGFEGTVYLS